MSVQSSPGPTVPSVFANIRTETLAPTSRLTPAARQSNAPHRCNVARGARPSLPLDLVDDRLDPVLPLFLGFHPHLWKGTAIDASRLEEVLEGRQGFFRDRSEAPQRLGRCQDERRLTDEQFRR